MSKKPHLDAAYDLKTPEESLKLYEAWADTYDESFAATLDYQTPRLIARAFVDHGGRGPVLDVGAGTGLVGQELAALGVSDIDATDISGEMLRVAKDKGVYRSLFTADITARMEVGDNTYDGIICAGTFTLGHVGPEGFDELIRIAAPGALFAISINSAHWVNAGFAAKFEALSGQIRDLSFAEIQFYGDKAAGDHANDTGKLALFRKA